MSSMEIRSGVSTSRRVSTQNHKGLWPLSLNMTVRYIGAQLSPINITIGSTRFFEPDRRVDGALLVNAGIRVGDLWSNRLSMDVRFYNLFDKAYDQGGSVAHPYPQAGRSVLVTVGYAR